MNDDEKITRGSRNIFADLGYADAQAHLLKAGLVTQIRELITEKKLTQAAAAKRIGLSQPDVSRLMRGQFRDISIERLLRMITKLDCDIDVVVRDHGKTKVSRDIFHLPSYHRQAPHTSF